MGLGLSGLITGNRPGIAPTSRPQYFGARHLMHSGQGTDAFALFIVGDDFGTLLGTGVRRLVGHPAFTLGARHARPKVLHQQIPLHLCRGRQHGQHNHPGCRCYVKLAELMKGYVRFLTL